MAGEDHRLVAHQKSEPEEPGFGRRRFLGFGAASPLQAGLALPPGNASNETLPHGSAGLDEAEAALDVFQFETAARAKLSEAAFSFLNGGADDLKTLHANHSVFDHLQIRARRLVDVSHVETRIELLGESLRVPILLAPIASLRMMHPDGSLAVARAAAATDHLMIASTVSNFSIREISRAGGKPVWFQLYPTDSRKVTRELLKRAEEAGCPVVVLTTDAPVIGNRESQEQVLKRLLEADPGDLANFRGIKEPYHTTDASLTWDFVDWLKSNTRMRLVLKSIVTAEDARLAVQKGVEGLIVSNHGGRQEESNRSTMECLPEVVEAVQGRIPVLIDSGFRRGTDIFKALALGATAVCVGRPYVWGLASFGQAGVEKVLNLLDEELVRIMQLAGTPSISDIRPTSIATRPWERPGW